MKYSGTVIKAAAFAILFAFLLGTTFAGQPQQPEKPKPDPKAVAGPMLSSNFYARDLKKVEKQNVGLTLELPDGWVFGNVAKINNFTLSSQKTDETRQAAQKENSRRLAVLYHEKRNLLLQFLYRDNAKNETIMTPIGERKARYTDTRFDEKYFIIHGTGLAMITADDVATNGAELKRIWAYFMPKNGRVIFEIFGVMPKKTYGKLDDALKELAAQVAFDSPKPGEGLKKSTKDAVVNLNTSPLIRDEYLVQDKKQKKKKSKVSAAPPWKVKRPKDWEWMDIDSWRDGEKPDPSRIKDQQQRESNERIWQQRVCGIYNRELDAYAVLRAVENNKEKVKSVYERWKNNLLGDSNVKVITTTDKYRFAQFMGCRLGYEFVHRKTGRKLVGLVHFAARGTNLFIVEVEMPKKSYGEFLKYDKKKKFVRKNFLF